MVYSLTIIVISIIAIIFIVVALKSKLSNRRLLAEDERLKAALAEAEKEKSLLMDELTQAASKGGVGETTILAVAGEMARMENNLYRMEDVPGRKQVLKALDRMKASLQAEGYSVVPLLGMPYREGMQMTAVFVMDGSLPEGSSVITSVQKPQVNRNGKMIQAASVTVGQNI